MMRKLPNWLYLGHVSYVCSTVLVIVVVKLVYGKMCARSQQYCTGCPAECNIVWLNGDVGCVPVSQQG